MNIKAFLIVFQLGLAIVVLLLSAPSSRAKTYYVSPSGDDTSLGTSVDKAWATIRNVNRTHFEPGDSVLFEGGSIFKGGIYIHKGNKGEVSKIAGTTSNPIVFSSYGTGWATISSGNLAGLKVYNAAGYKVERLIFSGAGVSTNESCGIEFYTDVADQILEYIWIDSVEVTGYREAGIAIVSWEQKSGGFKDVSITNSSSHDNGDAGITTYSEGNICHKNVYVAYNKVYNNSGIPDKWWTHSGNGIVLGGVEGGLIEYCEAYNNGGNNYYAQAGPLGIWGFHSSNLTIQYNESYDNKTNGGTDGGGFGIDGGCTNCTLQYNYSHGNDGAGFGISQFRNAPPMGNITLRYNISENDARKNNYGSIVIWAHSNSSGISGADIYNNTIYLSQPYKQTPSGVLIDLNLSKDIKVRNNIFYIIGAIRHIDVKGSSNIRFEGNNYWSPSRHINILWNKIQYNSLKEWGDATGQEMLNDSLVGYFLDPELKDPGKGVTVGDYKKLSTLDEYELKESSEIIDKGLDLTKEFGIDVGKMDFFGNSLEGLQEFSIGAYQMKKIISRPVTFVSFTAKQQGDAALLEWETVSEEANRGFDIEVSLDGYVFRHLGSVDGKFITSSLVQHYDFLDTEPGKIGIRYYRIRQVGLDGTAYYSSVLSLSFNSRPIDEIYAYPNPFKNEFTLVIAANKEKQLTLSMMDSMGRLILKKSLDLHIGSNVLRLSLPIKYSTGVYYLNAYHGDKSYQIKLLGLGN